MNKLMPFIVLALISTVSAFSANYKYCQTQYGEIELIIPAGSNHLFLAPHSLLANQRQIASLKTGEKADLTQWETLHYKNDSEKKFWSQKSLNFKSDFNKYIEVSMNDGKTHTFSLSCSKI